ncbi:hypothetical protein KUV50_05840 [Membranicola marinus]|uniref:Transcriptional regulator, ArsR family n=1 Tax=Membranihabitans marinus TaxID=1227546 RepID=A0A953L6H3_9BACT|nr:hypothetical protein [Membranihabitans marinus]MBY5957642.1 hypothetical protein [Membranihabitans marinus]
MKVDNVWSDIKDAHLGSFDILSPLRDGRAYTLIELSNAANTNRDYTHKFLDKLIRAGILHTRRNRKRTYYYLENELAAELAIFLKLPEDVNEKTLPDGMKFCRHCYRHLAGYVGVKLTEALVNRRFLIGQEVDYVVTERGWKMLSELGIKQSDFDDTKPLTKQCLDFSERKSHLGGQLGDALLDRMLTREWMVHVQDSRLIRMTDKGREELQMIIGEDLFHPG